MPSIPITGLPSNYRVPGVFAEILFAQGAATSSAGVREAVLVMPKSAAGTWTANTLYQITNEFDVRTGAGVGSPLHRAARIGLLCNKDWKLWAVPYAATSGGAPVAAAGTITITGPATASGVVSATVQGELCQVSYVNTDTATTIATRLAASINAKDWLACTANGAAGVVTLTAKITGLSQGDGTTGVIRYRCDATTGTGITIATSGAALGLGTGTPGAEGSTTELSNQLTALAVLDSVRKYYIGTSMWTASALTQTKTHISTKSEPRRGLRSRGVTAYTGIPASVATLGTGQNYEREHIFWQEASEHDNAEIVGNALAILQKREELDPVYNFDSYRGADWLIKPSVATTDWPTSDEQNDAINAGVTPIGSDGSGSFIVYLATTRSKNAAGTVDDPRALEGHRVSGADYVVDRILARYPLQFGAKRLKKDETLADGSVNANQRMPPKTITPSVVKRWLGDQINQVSESGEGVLQDSAATKDGMRTLVDPSNSGRVECAIDLRVTDLAHQASLRFAEVSTG